MENPRLLVTGADGFVGTILCQNLADAQRPFRALYRSAPVCSVGEWQCVPDIRSASWPSLVQDVDVIIHLAGRAHVIHDTSCDPLQAFREVNVTPTVALARAAAAAGVTRFVFVSSVGVHGDFTGDHTVAAASPVSPTTPYGVSKWEAEQALTGIMRETGMDYVVLRPPLMYGPNVKGNFLRLLRLVSRGIPLPLGAVRNRRSFLSVRSFADAILLCATHENVRNRTFTLADKQGISTPELLRTLGKALGRSPILLPVPIGALRAVAKLVHQQRAVSQLCDSLLVDGGDLRNCTGWSQAESSVAGLVEMARWYAETSSG